MYNKVQIPSYPLVWMEKYKRHMDSCNYTTGMQMVIVNGFLLIFMCIKSTNSAQLPLDWLLVWTK